MEHRLCTADEIQPLAVIANPDITVSVLEYLSDVLTDGVKFKVEAKRSDKKFPLNSVQLSI